jgi:hypothetical protein
MVLRDTICDTVADTARGDRERDWRSTGTSATVEREWHPTMCSCVATCGYAVLDRGLDGCIG